MGAEIRLENVTKSYPGTKAAAVGELSLTIPAGEIVMFVGPSGCGKTTSLKMINRLIEPTSGVISIAGEDVRQQGADELRRRVGYVIQGGSLFPHMTVAKNIALVPKMLGWDDDRIKKRTDELLDLVSLDPSRYRDRYPRELSGGQQQRVGVARGLAADPPVILMDEPFGAVDPITRQRLQDELLSIQRELHKTIVCVTHDIDEAIKLGDRILILQEGAQIAQYDVPEVVLASPANEFVADFVGAGSALKQLSLSRVTEVELRSPTTAKIGEQTAEVKARAEANGDRAVVVLGRPGPAPGLAVVAPAEGRHRLRAGRRARQRRPPGHAERRPRHDAHQQSRRGHHHRRPGHVPRDRRLRLRHRPHALHAGQGERRGPAQRRGRGAPGPRRADHGGGRRHRGASRARSGGRAMSEAATEDETQTSGQRRGRLRGLDRTATLEVIGIPVLVVVLFLGYVLWRQTATLDSVEESALGWSALLLAIRQQIVLTVVASVIVVGVAVPLGVLLTRPGIKRIAPGVVAVANFGQAAPAIGLIVLFAIWFAYGFWTAILALVVYGVLPVLSNTIVGLQGVSPTLVEAGRGVGMSNAAVLFRIELPLAVPVIMSGIRTSLVLVVGTAALATFIAAGALGGLVTTGISLDRTRVLISGAVLIALIALLVEWAGRMLELFVRPKGI